MFKKNQKNIKKIKFKGKYTPEREKKLKNEGLKLKIGNKTARFKIKKEIFKNSFKKPVIGVVEESNARIGILFNIPEDSESVYIDIKEINRFTKPWTCVASYDGIEKNKEHIFPYDFTKGQSIKIRVSYKKEGSIIFEDMIFEDKNFKFSYDPPEIVIFRRNKDISLRIFNIQRFNEGGYIRVFKKENEENEECIFVGDIKSTIFSYNDEDVESCNFYKYRAEVYDNLGNIYHVEPKKVLYQKLIDAKKIEVLKREDGSFFYEDSRATSYIVEKSNIITEEIESIEFNYEKADSGITFFLDPDLNERYFVKIEGYTKEGKLSSFGEISATDMKEEVRIFDETIETNSKFENIIKWNHSGNIDSFIVTRINAFGKSIVETVPHRVSSYGYLYCVDSNYKKERVDTEYVINAIDEFGKIVYRKKIVR